MAVCSVINRLILRREGELASISRARGDHKGDNLGQDRDRDSPAASCQKLSEAVTGAYFTSPYAENYFYSRLFIEYESIFISCTNQIYMCCIL